MSIVLLLAMVALATIASGNNAPLYTDKLFPIAAQCGPDRSWLVALPNHSLALDPVWSSSLDHMFIIDSGSGPEGTPRGSRLRSLDGAVSTLLALEPIAQDCEFMRAPNHIGAHPVPIGRMNLGSAKRDQPTWPPINFTIYNGTIFYMRVWPYDSPATDGISIRPNNEEGNFGGLGTAYAGMNIRSNAFNGQTILYAWFIESLWVDGKPYFRLRSWGNGNLVINLAGASTQVGGNAILWPLHGDNNELFTIWSANTGTGFCTNLYSPNCYLMFQFKHSGLFLSAHMPQTENSPVVQNEFSIFSSYIVFHILGACCQ
jgi:hypothetical protein